MTEFIFTLDAGAGIRGRIRREIEGAAWSWGLEIKTDESKGFLASVYRFTVSGSERGVVGFGEAIEKWAREIEND